jgi:hypothetical protein
MLTFGEEIDALDALRDEIRKLEAQIDDLQKQYEVREGALLARLDEEGMRKATGSGATVSVSESTVGRIVNWEELCRYVRRNNAFHLLHRRLASAPYNELREARGKKGVPGVLPFTQRKLKLNKLT